MEVILLLLNVKVLSWANFEKPVGILVSELLDKSIALIAAVVEMLAKMPLNAESERPWFGHEMISDSGLSASEQTQGAM